VGDRPAFRPVRTGARPVVAVRAAEMTVMSTIRSVGEAEDMAVTSQAGGTRRVAEILAPQGRIHVWALRWRYLAIIGTGYFFTFYDISDIGFGILQIQTQLRLTGAVGYPVGAALMA
jgi:hypothetical protein